MKDNVLGFVLDADTSKLQKKLRAIAKHAEALANELDAIENGFVCPECEGTNMCQWFNDGAPYHTSCNDCGHVIEDDVLPKGLEGSA